MPTRNNNLSFHTLLYSLTQPAGVEFIYQGENRADYDKVSSNLYREYKDTTTFKHIGIDQIEDLEIEAAARHTSESLNEDELRSLVQHYHGKTNAIDFTGDVNVALFFACDGEFASPGRIIRLDPKSTVCDIYLPTAPSHRTSVQKSVFVTPPHGYILPDEYKDNTITIPADLKLPVLDYLRRYHQISSTTIYNDLHGFVHYRANHKATVEMNFDAFSLDASGEHEKAIDLLGKSIARDPQTSITHLLKGVINHNNGKYEEAFDSFNTAISISPNNAEAYNCRGWCYHYLDYKRKAMRDYNTALSIRPDHTLALNNRGLLRHELGDHSRAMRDYNRALRIDPYLELALNGRGLLHLEQGNAELAIADFSRAITETPRWAALYLNRGHAHLAIGNCEQGEADIQKAIELDPELERSSPGTNASQTPNT